MLSSLLALPIMMIQLALAGPTYRFTCSWNQSAAPIAPYWFAAMSDDGLVQAATDQENIYISNNAFARDNTVIYNIPSETICMNGNGSLILAAGYTESHLLDTRNGEWVNSSVSFEITSCALSNDGRYQIMAGLNSFMFSNDFGASFEEFQANNTGGYNNWFAGFEGDVAVVGYGTQSSYVSFNAGESFDTFKFVQRSDSQVSWMTSSADGKWNYIATEAGLLVGNEMGNFTTVLNGSFHGIATSATGQYVLANTSDDYWISTDFGNTWILGDGLVQTGDFGNMFLSNNASKAMLVSWVDDATLMEGDCGWGFNPFVTATAVVHGVEVVITVADVVVVPKIVYV